MNINLTIHGIFKIIHTCDNISMYDESSNRIHRKYGNGFEVWHEYDKNNNETHYKSSLGFEQWWNYDSNGNEIHYTDSDGTEEWKQYQNSTLVHTKRCN